MDNLRGRTLMIILFVTRYLLYGRMARGIGDIFTDENY